MIVTGTDRHDAVKGDAIYNADCQRMGAGEHQRVGKAVWKAADQSAGRLTVLQLRLTGGCAATRQMWLQLCGSAPLCGPHLSVALSVLEEVEQELNRLHGPATRAAGVVLVLGLGSTANAAVEAPEGDAPLAQQHSLQVLLGSLKSLTLDGEGSLTGVLEVNTQV